MEQGPVPGNQCAIEPDQAVAIIEGKHLTHRNVKPVKDTPFSPNARGR
jgi:hypothetical protein